MKTIVSTYMKKYLVLLQKIVSRITQYGYQTESVSGKEETEGVEY